MCRKCYIDRIKHLDPTHHYVTEATIRKYISDQYWNRACWIYLLLSKLNIEFDKKSEY